MSTSKRERELARMRAERQAARRAAEAARRRQRNAVIASVLAVALVGAGSVGLWAALRDDAPDALDTAQPGTSTSASAAASTGATKPAAAAGDGTCAYDKAGEASGDRKVELPPTKGVETKRPAQATLATNRGEIVLTLDSAKAPCTSNSMRSLAHYQYFDGTKCHRLTTEGIFVLQCGDPTGEGSGGPGYQFGEENLTAFGEPNEQGQVIYPAGTVAMANAGSGTNGSQFFLVYKDSPLAPDYTPFGKITKGLDLLLEVAKAGVEGGGGDGPPAQEVVITTLRTRLV